MSAHQHHYLSQCYLRDLTSGNAKNSKLTVIDFKEKKHFETIPRNVGVLRDFNRIDIEGFPQDIIETTLAEFESGASLALKRVDEGAAFEGDDKIFILNLMALLAARSPERRENWRQIQAQIAEQLIDFTLASEDRWDSQIEQLRRAGGPVHEAVTYEKMKEFVEKKQYTIEVPTERHIDLELVAIEAILPCLFNRNWIVLRSTEESGPYIATDHPVVLLWKDPGNIPRLYQNSPGFGLRGTQIFFALSSKVVIVGEFDGELGDTEADPRTVAVLNGIFLQNFHKQVYAPKLSFKFVGNKGEIVEGRQLLKSL